MSFEAAHCDGGARDATEQALARVQALEEDTGTAWQRLRGEVVGQEEGIGHGRLAQALLPTYTPLAEPARVLADSALAQVAASLHGGRVSWLCTSSTACSAPADHGASSRGSPGRLPVVAAVVVQVVVGWWSRRVVPNQRVITGPAVASRRT
jgi:hypothetical protein